MSTINITNLKNPSSGSNNIVLNADGTTTLTPSNIIKSGTAVASTSGTSIDFTGLPSWVKRVTVMFAGVSTSGTSVHLLQIGDSGGIENTGYAANAFNYATQSTYTTGYGLQTATSAAASFSGAITISLLTPDTWVASGNLSSSGAGDAFAISGSKTLSSTLDRVRITTVGGTDTFDAGTINLLWEG